MLKKKLILLFLLVSIGSWAQQNNDLKSKSVLSQKAIMLIPKDFTLMSAETVAKKYPIVGHRPTEVYTNSRGTINIALNHTINAAKESDLEAIKKQMDIQFNQPQIDFRKSEIRTLNGRKFIILEFVSPAADTKIYNLMAMTSIEGRLAMFTFNCTEEYKKDWSPIGKRIIESIQVSLAVN